MNITRVQPPLPSFLIIGAQRCGTRWLGFNLAKHPDIYVPTKHLDYFSDPQRMEEWKLSGYRWKFEDWDEEPIVGESSPSYMRPSFHVGHMSQRIRRALPDVRLVAILRNPVERIESAGRAYSKTGQLPRGVDINTYVQENPARIAQLDIFGASFYARCLRPYVHRFGDRLKILFLDDVVADPVSVYRDVLAHIGASDDFVPHDLDRVMFSTLKTVQWVPPTQEQREATYEFFRDDVAELEEMTGRDLSHWDPANWDPANAVHQAS